jgi:hypothetical protein
MKTFIKSILVCAIIALVGAFSVANAGNVQVQNDPVSKSDYSLIESPTPSEKAVSWVLGPSINFNITNYSTSFTYTLAGGTTYLAVIINTGSSPLRVTLDGVLMGDVPVGATRSFSGSSTTTSMNVYISSVGSKYGSGTITCNSK